MITAEFYRFLLGSKVEGLRDRSPAVGPEVKSFSVCENTFLCIICSYVAEIYAAYFFTEFDVVEVYIAEIAVEFNHCNNALCRYLGCKSSNFLAFWIRYIDF